MPSDHYTKLSIHDDSCSFQGISLNEKNGNFERLARTYLVASISYMLTTGVCGIVLCALGSSIIYFRDKLGFDPIALVGKSFLCRGVGSLTGTSLSTYFYSHYNGDRILVINLIVISVLMILLPLATNDVQIFVYFFIFGLCASLNDTGVSILIRKLHGKKAGPWLAINSLSFSMSAAIVPTVEYAVSFINTSHRNIYSYDIISIIILSIAFLQYYSYKNIMNIKDEHIISTIRDNHELNENLKEKLRELDEFHPHYHVELLIAFMNFCFIGGQVNTIAFIQSEYLNKSHLKVTNVIIIFWICVTMGRIIGLYDQSKLTSFMDNTLIFHFNIICFIAGVSILILSFNMDSLLCFYITFPIYGLCFGPCFGFAHDLNNRLTLPTELSTAIIMMGVNLGASIVPFLSSYILFLHEENSPRILLIILSMTMLLPIIPLNLCQSLSYNKDLRDFYNHRVNSLYDYHVVHRRHFRALVDTIILVNRIKKLVHNHHVDTNKLILSEDKTTLTKISYGSMS